MLVPCEFVLICRWIGEKMQKCEKLKGAPAVVLARPSSHMLYLKKLEAPQWMQMRAPAPFICSLGWVTELSRPSAHIYFQGKANAPQRTKKRAPTALRIWIFENSGFPNYGDFEDNLGIINQGEKTYHKTFELGEHNGAADTEHNTSRGVVIAWRRLEGSRRQPKNKTSTSFFFLVPFSFLVVVRI